MSELNAFAGLPGSVGAVSISRLSTLLHAFGSPPPPTKWSLTKISSVSDLVRWDSTVPSSHRPWLSAATLFGIALPVQLTFLIFVYATGWMDLPFMFVGTFIAFFCFSVGRGSLSRRLAVLTILAYQVISSLTLAHFATLLFWSNGYDPDNYCLPVHSALCDLVGQLMLVACYELVGQMGGDVGLR